MNIAWVQYDIAWQDAASNLEALEQLIETKSSDFDLLVLPEMFDTGFSMKPQEIKRDQDVTIQWMKDIANKYDCGVLGSLAYQENAFYYNRLIFTEGSEIASYDKNHLFTLSGEDEHYEEGDSVLDFHWRGHKIRPLICYDLRFPEIARNTEDLSLLIYVASWPQPRILHWETLLKARAIENQCFVLGVNRLGGDGNGFNYNGHSQLINYDGAILQDSENFPILSQATIEISALDNYREKLPFLKDCKLLDLQ